MTTLHSSRGHRLPWMVLCAVIGLIPVHRAQGHSAAPQGARVLLPGDTLVGRTAEGGLVSLLTERGDLISVEPHGHRIRRARIEGLRVGESLAGLGTLGGRELYTIGAHRSLITVRDGRVAARRELTAAHFELFGWRGGLLVQALPLDPGGPALWRLATPESIRAAVGHLTVRSVQGPRVLAWTRSLVRCGVPAAEVLPCWNTFEATIDQITAPAVAVPLRLVDLESSLPIDLEGPASRLPRPVRDAAILPDRTVLVLTAGPGEATSSSVRQLRRYQRDGQLKAVSRVPVSCRLLLWITTTRAVLLGSNGEIVDVEVP